MSIPSTQLGTWTNIGGTTASSNAYAAIDRALTAAPTSTVRGRNFDIFLQGSYRNRTNIYGDSDIDVVCVFRDTNTTNYATLPVIDQRLVPQGPAAVYLVGDFRRDVLASLRAAFGAGRAQEGTRAIHVDTGHGREADVIPSIRYYHYYRPGPLSPQLFAHEGIAFLSRNQWIYNFPRQHIENGEGKNAVGRTNSNYKPTVRMFKNARNAAVDRGLLARDDAPSYFVEGLLYNAPDALFTTDAEATFVNVFNHLDQSVLNNMVSQNGIIPLIGMTSTQWQLAAAQRFLAALRQLWLTW